MFPGEPVPDRIGSYKVIRRLSRTGSADVYLGLMEGPMGFRRTCELKLVANAVAGEADLSEELAREAAICSRLNHPAILRIFDFFELDRRLVLVVEHLDGADLERLLQHLQRRKQKLGDEAIWYIAHQLLGALSHAHAATDEDGNLTPIVHRNLAPDNVLIGWDGQVRLAGFGLGKILGRSPDTVVGVIKGRPGYMAPEQARGERVTPRADVYGVGLLLWCLLTGRVPPINGTRPESLSSVRPDVQPEIAAAIDAALEPSPDKRKITCAEIETWLKKITKPEAGRADLQEKIVRLRSTRAPLGEGAVEAPHSARPPAKVTGQRRRLAIRGLHAQQQPGAAFARSAPSSRPPARMETSVSTMPPPSRSEPPPSMRRYPNEARSERPPPSYAPGSSQAPPWMPTRTRSSARSEAPPTSRAGGSGARRLFDDDDMPPSFGAPVAAPESVAPRGLASQPPPALSLAPLVLPPPPAPPPPSSTAPPSAAEGASFATNGSMDLAPSTLGSGNGASVVSFEPPPPQMFQPPTSASDPDAAALGKPPVGSRLSALQSVVVAAVTAAVVVGAGIFFAEWRNDGAPSPLPPPQFASSPRPPERAPRPSTSTTATAASATAGPLPPASAPRPGDPSTLPGGYGYLTVRSPIVAVVYVNGHRVGATNEPVQALCGQRFVRLGTITDSGPSWVAPGLSVNIPCQASISVESKPAPSY